MRRAIALRKFEQVKSVIKIQKVWRCYKCQSIYMFITIDIITIQSIMRRWLSMRKIQYLKEEHRLFRSKCALQIQTHVRRIIAVRMYTQEKAAVQIQKTWRGYQGYTDYIFFIVDVVTIQNKIRQWLAVCKLKYLKDVVKTQVKIRQWLSR
mmetsp:Transcript_5149/g.7469  ORF Transcript_5149/g.7469 Transcript_5149/m.7469 type:complete len:151 (-) Transcript_5149:131-583(-)